MTNSPVIRFTAAELRALTDALAGDLTRQPGGAIHRITTGRRVRAAETLVRRQHILERGGGYMLSVAAGRALQSGGAR